MNLPIFEDVIIFQLDKEPVISKVDKNKWNLNVKNDENWKVFGACTILFKCCKLYEDVQQKLNVQNKKEEEEKQDLGLEVRMENIVTRIQYLFNFIMNYRSRYAH